MTSIRSYLLGAGLVSGGFLLGWAMPSTNVQAQKAGVAPRPVAPVPKVKPKDVDKPKNPWAREDGLPSFAYQDFQWLKPYECPPRAMMELRATQVPGLDEYASETDFRKLDFVLVNVYNPKNGNTPATATVAFKNVEKLHFLRMDELDAKMTKAVDDVSWDSGLWCKTSQENDNYWYENFGGAVVLPPVDRDGRGAEFTWEIKRHANGRVKLVTPYIGETEKRMHGWQFAYNDEGMLLSMTPYVDGKKHGVQRNFEGTSRSRLQEPTSTVEWSNGLRVVEKAPAIKPKAPPVK